jgi:hypothetical protein
MFFLLKNFSVAAIYHRGWDKIGAGVITITVQSLASEALQDR